MITRLLFLVSFLMYVCIGQITAQCDITTTDDLCAGSTVTFELETCSTMGTISWSITAGGGGASGTIAGGQATTTLSVDLNSIAGDFTIEVDTGMVAVTETFTIVAFDDASAGTYSALCDNDSPITLTGTPTDSDGVWTGTGVTDNNDGTASFDPSGLSGTITVTYSYDSGIGCPDSDDTDIVVNAFTEADAGSYPDICNNADPITLTGTPTDSNGAWVGSGVTDNGDGTASFDPDGLTGNITVTYAYDAGVGCPDSDNTNISIDIASTPSTGTYPPVCENASNVSLSGSPSGGTWSGQGVSDGGGPNGTFDPSGLSGPITIYYSDTQNGCTAVDSTVIVVNPLPVIDNATTTQEICSGDMTVDINFSSTPSADAYSWTTNDNNIVGNPPDGSGTSIAGTTFEVTSGQASGTVTYTVTPSLAGCIGPTQDFVITVNALPQIDNIVTNCTGASVDDVVVTASIPGGGTLQYNIDGLAYQASNTFPAVSQGNHIFGVRDVANMCETSMLFDVACNCPAVTLNNIMADQEFCFGNPASVLTGVAAVLVPPAPFDYQWQSRNVGTMSWTDEVTTQNFDPGTPSQSKEYRRLVQVDLCPDDASNIVTITVNPLPNSPVSGGNVDNCANEPNTPVTATVGASESVTWYDAPAGGTQLGIGNSYTSTETAPATYIYYAEASNSNSCVQPTRTPVELTIDPTPSVPVATQNEETCEGSPNPPLIVTIASGTVDWYDAPVGGTLLGNGASFTSSETAPAIYSYWAEARETGTGCVSNSRTEMTLQINARPANVTTQMNQTNCFGDTPNPALQVTVGAGETAQWYLGQTGGSPIATGTTSYVSDETAPGIYTYWIEAINSDLCVSAQRQFMTLEITELPVSPAPGNDVDNCEGTTPNPPVSATPPAGSTIRWYDQATNGTLLQSGNTYVSPETAPATYTYWAESTNSVSSCSSSARVPVELTINGRPSTPVNATNAENCAGSTPNPAVSANVPSGQVIDWYDASTGGNLLAQASTTYVGPQSTAGIYTFYAEARDNDFNCTSANRLPVTLTINPNPEAPSAAQNAVNCEGITPNPAVSVTAPANSTIDWYNSSTGGTLLATSTTSFVSPETSVATYNYYAEAISSENCISPTRTLVTLTINPVPVFQGIVVTCDGGTLESVEVQATIPSGTLEYRVDNGPWQSSPIFLGLTTGAHTFDINEINTDCFVTSGPQEVNCACPNVLNNTIASDQAICGGTSPMQLVGGVVTTDPAATFTYQWQSKAAGSSTWVDEVTTVNFSPGSLTTTTEYRRLVEVSDCPDHISNVISVFIKPDPIVSNSMTEQEICSQQSSAPVLLLSNPANASFSWTSSSTNVNGNTANGNGDLPPEILTLNMSNNSGSVQYTVTPTLDECVGPTKTFTTIVNTLPEFTISSSTGQGICPGELATLKPEGLPNGNYSYLWTLPVGPPQPVDEINVSVTAANLNQFTLLVTDNVTGCTFSQTFTFNLVTFNPTLVTNPADGIICEGEELSFTANGGNTFEWEGFGSPADNETSFFTASPPVGSNPYTLTLSNDENCSEDFALNVIVNATPIPNIITNTNSTEFCEGDPIILMTEIPYEEYEWSNNKTDDSISFIANPANESFDVDIVDINGCENTDQIQLTIHESPTGQICNSAAGVDCNVFNVISEQEVEFSAQDVVVDEDCGEVQSYRWIFRRDGIIEIDETVNTPILPITFAIAEEGIYDIELIITDECSCSSLGVIYQDFEVISNTACSAGITTDLKACLGAKNDLIATPFAGSGGSNIPRYGYFVVDGLKIIDGQIDATNPTEVILSDIVVGVPISGTSGKQFVIHFIDQEFEANNDKFFNDIVEIEYLEEGIYEIEYVYNFTACAETRDRTVEVFALPEFTDNTFSLFDLEACDGEESVDFPFDIPSNDVDWVMTYVKDGSTLTKSLNEDNGNIAEISIPGSNNVIVVLANLLDVESGCSNDEYVGEEFVIEVLDPVTATYTSECNDDNDTIFYTLEIAGGTGDYLVNGNAISGSSFSTDGLTPEEPQTFFIEDVGCDEDYEVPISNVVGSCEFCIDFGIFTNQLMVTAQEQLDICVNEPTSFAFDFTESEIDDFKDTLLSNQTILYVIQEVTSNIYVESEALVKYRPLNEQFVNISEMPLVFEGGLDSVLVVGQQYYLTAFVVASAQSLIPPLTGCPGIASIPIRFYDAPTANIDGSISEDLTFCKQEIDFVLGTMGNADVNTWSSSDPVNVEIVSDNPNNRAIISFNVEIETDVRIYLDQFNQYSITGGTLNCGGRDSVDLTLIDMIAPIEDSIIWFPGDFLTYTDADKCYQWGYINEQGVLVELTDEISRFYIYQEDGNLTDKTFFVDVWECSDTQEQCVTRVYYNSSTPPVFGYKPNANYDVSLFPNPNNGEFILKLEGEQAGVFQVKLFSTTGVLLHNSEFIKEYDEHEQIYNFSDYAEGMYILSVVDEGGKTNIIKVIKQ